MKGDRNGSSPSGVSRYRSLNSLPDKFFASGGSKPSSHFMIPRVRLPRLLQLPPPYVGCDAEVIHGLCLEKQCASGMKRALVLISQWIGTQSITLSAMKNQRAVLDSELDLFSSFLWAKWAVSS